MLALTQFLGLQKFLTCASSTPPAEDRPLQWREIAGDNWRAALALGRNPTVDEMVAELNAMGMVWAQDEPICSK